MDDRGFERINPDIAGRPQLIKGNSQLLFSGMRVAEGCVVSMRNKSHQVTANVVVPKDGATGVIVTQGGSAGGWTLYAHEGRLKYCYCYFGIEHFMAEAIKKIPAGAHQVRMEFTYDGGGLGKDGDVTPATSVRTPAHRLRRTMGPPTTSSPARSSGCRSTSARTATTT